MNKLPGDLIKYNLAEYFDDDSLKSFAESNKNNSVIVESAYYKAKKKLEQCLSSISSKTSLGEVEDISHHQVYEETIEIESELDSKKIVDATDIQEELANSIIKYNLRDFQNKTITDIILLDETSVMTMVVMQYYHSSKYIYLH
jgi:hypothetical protein